MKRIVMVLITLMLMPFMTLATTWYVDGTNGSDSYSGKSRSAAKKTIQAAIDVAADGDTILVAPGTYDVFSSFNKFMTIQGVGAASATVIDGGGRYVRGNSLLLGGDGDLAYGMTNTVLSGFTIQHLVNVHGGTLKRCIVRDNNCRSIGNGACVGSVIENSLLYNNQGMNGGAGDGCFFRNCTITANSSGNFGAALNSALENCIVYGNSGNYLGTWNTWFPVDSFVAKLGFRERNVFTEDPKFVDAANGDYRLASDSPCIDTGNNSYVSSNTDLDGKARIINGTIDIGCYEYSARMAVQLWANGPYWATSNVGATLPEEQGYTFLYGDDNAYVRDGGVEGAWVKVGNKVNPSASNPAAAYWGDGWRWPSSAEWRNLFTMCEYSFVTNNGTQGWLVRGRDSFSNNMIFLPVVPPDLEDDTSEYWLQDYRTDNGDVAQIRSDISADDSRRIGPCLVHWWGFVGAGALLRAVRDSSPVPCQTYSVCFDIGQYGVRTGGGALSQTVNSGAAAIEPTVTAKDGYVFMGWDGRFDAVVRNLTITALYSPCVYSITYTDTKGAANPNPLTYTIEDVVTFAALPDVDGWKFVGWSSDGIDKGNVGNVTVVAHWQEQIVEPTIFTVQFNANGGTCTRTSVEVEEGASVGTLPTASRTGYDFLGWFTAANGGVQVSASTVVTEDATWYAHWQEQSEDPIVPPVDPGEDDEPMDASIANTYDGVIIDADGLPMGYITVKAAKASGKGDARVSKVTATIQMVGEAKKVTVKANVVVAEATMTQAAADGRILDLTFSRYGIWGTFDDYEIDGVRNLLASTAASDKGTEAKSAAESACNALKGNYVMAYGDENGYNGLSVTIMAKGKVKVSGKLSNGTSVSTTSQLIVGSDYSIVPVIYTKKDTSLAFNIYFTNDGSEAEVFGYYDAVISSVSGLGSGLSFCLGDTIYDLFDERYMLCDEFLPYGLSVEPVSATKWSVANGAKAGSVKVNKDGEVVDTKDSENPSGLKLTFSSRAGTFSGSFKVYALDSKGKLKTFTATVSGVVVDGLGYGVATIKGLGSVAVTIE